MERRYELDLIRSIVMLTPGTAALRREEAIRLLDELTAVQERLDHLRAGLRRLLGEEGERA